MFVPFFVDGPLRGRFEPLPIPEFYEGHAQAVQVARDCGGLVPYTEPATVRHAEKPWQPDKWIYRYQFKTLTILSRKVVIGWCAKEPPSDAALFSALINLKVLSATALQDTFMSTALQDALMSPPSETPGDGK